MQIMSANLLNCLNMKENVTRFDSMFKWLST